MLEKYQLFHEMHMNVFKAPTLVDPRHEEWAAALTPGSPPADLESERHAELIAAQQNRPLPADGRQRREPCGSTAKVSEAQSGGPATPMESMDDGGDETATVCRSRRRNAGTDFDHTAAGGSFHFRWLDKIATTGHGPKTDPLPLASGDSSIKERMITLPPR